MACQTGDDGSKMMSIFRITMDTMRIRGGSTEYIVQSKVKESVKIDQRLVMT